MSRSTEGRVGQTAVGRPNWSAPSVTLCQDTELTPYVLRASDGLTAVKRGFITDLEGTIWFRYDKTLSLNFCRMETYSQKPGEVSKSDTSQQTSEVWQSVHRGDMDEGRNVEKRGVKGRPDRCCWWKIVEEPLKVWPSLLIFYFICYSFRSQAKNETSKLTNMKTPQQEGPIRGLNQGFLLVTVVTTPPLFSPSYIKATKSHLLLQLHI